MNPTNTTTAPKINFSITFEVPSLVFSAPRTRLADHALA
jgi:hypothetical protein